METATEHLSPPPQRVQFSEEIAMAARLFIAMIKNCNYDEPIDFDLLDSDLDQSSASESPPSTSAELVGTKRRANGSSGHTRRKSRKTSSTRMSKKQIGKNTLVAAWIRLPEGNFEWVMSKVTSYAPESKMYTVVDEDSDEPDSRPKKYKVSRKDMRLIDLNNPNLSRPRNTRVLAVYPDTSVFYPAIVKSMSKKKETYLLEFEGEEEPVEAVSVPAKYVIDIERTH